MSTAISANEFSSKLKAILEEFGDDVFSAADNEGLDAAEKVAIEALEAASPVGKTGKFKKSWKSSRYKLVRFIGNNKMVSAGDKLSKRSGDSKGKIPLSNILEYSTTRGKPFIRETFAANEDRIANAMIEAIVQKLT